MTDTPHYKCEASTNETGNGSDEPLRPLKIESIFLIFIKSFYGICETLIYYKVIIGIVGNNTDNKEENKNDQRYKQTDSKYPE